MNKPTPNIDDLHDQLVDRALREIVGGEAPPDLSEQILTAAKMQAESACGLAATPRGAEAMRDPKSTHGKFSWGRLAIAASLLVVAGALLLPYLQSARKSAQQDVTSPKASEVRADPRTSLEASSGRESSDDQTVSGRAVKTQLSQPADAPLTDNDSLTRAPKKDLKMMVTPHVIVEAEESSESRLGKGVVSGSPASGVGGQGGTVAEEKIYTFSLGFTPGKALKKESTGGTRLDISAAAPAESSDRVASAGREIETESYRRAPASLGHRWVENSPKSKVGRVSGEPIMGLRGLVDNAYTGRGPGNSGDRYTRIYENPFKAVSTDSEENRLSTFSIDVDTASYANVRQFLMQSNMLPPADAVRIEELVNYFDYDYSGPTGDVPFSAHVEVAGCPWQPAHRLVRIGIKGREIARQQRPQSNLVFLIDVSGSMNQSNKLPLLVEGMKLLVRELGENDRVAIVVYASSEGLALASTPGDRQDVILSSLEKLRAGGSTAGGAGIALAYKVAKENFITGGVNRVILCTDGDFNVGVTSPAELERMAEKNAKKTGVFLTVLGFGRGNLNDAMMEKISGKGNGNYHYVDGLTEARKVLVEEMAGTLVTIAKDVKIQIEFNPAQVAGYRLIGYENRLLANQDFNDDKKDAGEIGAGHTVTALYEIVPVGQTVNVPGVDPLKYGSPKSPQPNTPTSNEAADVSSTAAAGEMASDELLTLKIRYKRPDGDASTKLEFPITDNRQQFGAASDDFKFAAAVASFGMLLRDSEHRGNASYSGVLEIAEDGAKRDPHGYRAEFLKIVQRARQLASE